jgi:hypothetical protein
MLMNKKENSSKPELMLLGNLGKEGTIIKRHRI